MGKLLWAFVCVVLGGCAATEPNMTAEPVTEKEYRTGSNIPAKSRKGDGVMVMSPEELERIKNASPGSTAPPRGK